jgi:hypothetical protein
LRLIPPPEKSSFPISASQGGYRLETGNPKISEMNEITPIMKKGEGTEILRPL